MNDPRVLFVSHGHPDLQPGGTERFSHDLFGAVRARGVPAMYLAGVTRHRRELKCGTVFQSLGGGADEMLLSSDLFDSFHLARPDGIALMADLVELLRSFRPDVVHFHHVLFVGVETIFAVRRVLPDVRIVMTLHDYVPICANDGLMTKRPSGQLCSSSSPDACHACFPEIHQSRFAMRERHIKNMFGLVDRFIVPSETARRLYRAWGIPAARMDLIPNGTVAARAPRQAKEQARRRSRFGVFGVLAPHKGILIALEAARLAAEGGGEFTLQLHGDLDHQPEEFKKRVHDAAAASGGRVRLFGRYAREDLPARMAAVDWVIVPSTWWENAPLTIMEAFAHRRPVIAADAGGMAEAVRDNVDGLHFSFGDSIDLARVMGRAMEEPELWARLAKGISAPLGIEESAARHLALYRDLVAARSRDAA